MPRANASSIFFLQFAVTVSIFGLVIIPILLLQSDKYRIDFSSSEILVGSLYSVICILGIFAVFYPKKCENTFMFKKHMELRRYGDHPVLSETMQFKGHHPNCKEFSTNRIKIQNAVLCSACTGLLVGAMGTLIGTLFYFFIGFTLTQADPKFLFVGDAGMLLGLVQFKFGGYLKLMVNALFVLGSFITLITADLLGKSLFIDLYVLGLIVFLLLTRILISEWNNKRICVKCEGCELHK